MEAGRKVAVVLWLAFAVALVTATVGVALTQSDRSSDQPPPAREKSAGVDARLTSGLRAFKREHRPTDALPADARRTLAATSSLGLNLDLSRHARGGPDGQEYYLVAGNDSVALVNDAGVGGIDDISHALSGQGISVQDCAMGGRGIRVVGLLPESASNARVELRDGSVKPVDVENNVYVLLFLKSADALPTQILWEEAGSTKGAPVPVPSDILDGTCHKAAAP